MSFKKLAVAVSVLGLSTAAVASPMLSGEPRTVTVQYYSGDKVTIACRRNGACGLEFFVDGKKFSYRSADLGGLEIEPREAILYSFPRSRPNRYFTFKVSVYCPEVDGVASSREESCYASGAVSEGKPPHVQLIRQSISYSGSNAGA